jgi:hypothetical protein
VGSVPWDVRRVAQQKMCDGASSAGRQLVHRPRKQRRHARHFVGPQMQTGEIEHTIGALSSIAWREPKHVHAELLRVLNRASLSCLADGLRNDSGKLRVWHHRRQRQMAGAERGVADRRRQSEMEVSAPTRARVLPRCRSEHRMCWSHTGPVDEEQPGRDRVFDRKRIHDRRQLGAAHTGAQRHGEQRAAHRVGQSSHARSAVRLFATSGA